MAKKVGGTPFNGANMVLDCYGYSRMTIMSPPTLLVCVQLSNGVFLKHYGGTSVTERGGKGRGGGIGRR